MSNIYSKAAMLSVELESLTQCNTSENTIGTFNLLQEILKDTNSLVKSITSGDFINLSNVKSFMQIELKKERVTMDEIKRKTFEINKLAIAKGDEASERSRAAIKRSNAAVENSKRLFMPIWPKQVA